MFRLTLLVVLFTCTNAAILPEARIVGGSLADISDAPWQVALLYDNNNNGIFNQACGGVIIGKSAILSSAQCIYGTSPARWRIRAGSSFHNSEGQVIQVSRFKIHEQYNSNDLNNDLAILYLTGPITLGKSVTTVTLPAQGLPVIDGTSCFVTGWGRLTAGGAIPVQLHKMTVPSVNQSQCVNAYSGINPVTDNMLCAGRIGIGGVDACQGDTGGPMTINNVLVGINSWGMGCGEPQYPGVYTRVPMYRIWINNNV